MYHIFNIIVTKKSFKALILTAFGILFYTIVNAQTYSATDAPKRNSQGLTYGDGGGGYGDKSSALSLNVGYDIPEGYMSSSFKAAPTFSLSYLQNYSAFTFNATIGYVSYKPKYDTVAFIDGDPADGYFQYGHFNSLEFYTGAAYNVPITDNAKFYFGLDIGTYLNFFKYSINDGEGDINTYSTTYSQQFVAPKLGVDFMVSDNVSLGLQAKYNFIFSGPQSSDIANENYDVDYTALAYKTFSGHITITYHF
jgi:hypothetical protein